MDFKLCFQGQGFIITAHNAFRSRPSEILVQGTSPSPSKTNLSCSLCCVRKRSGGVKYEGLDNTEVAIAMNGNDVPRGSVPPKKPSTKPNYQEGNVFYEVNVGFALHGYDTSDYPRTYESVSVSRLRLVIASICVSSACLPWKRAYHEIPKASSHELFGWKERFGYWSVRAACRLRRHFFKLVLTAFQC